MKRKKTALIILSQILEMPLERYLTYINKKTNTIADKARSILYVRFFLTDQFIQVENELLKQFKRTYGELPKGNILGG